MTPYYTDDWVTIYHGEAVRVLSQMEPGSVDAVVTDPPYSSGGQYRGDRAKKPSQKYRGNIDGGEVRDVGCFSGDNRDQLSWLSWVAAWGWECGNVMGPSRHFFMFSDWRQVGAAISAIQVGGLVYRGLLTWDKTEGGGGRPLRGRFRQHSEFIVWGTTGPMDVITDEFPGSVIRVTSEPHTTRVHPTQKPADLIGHLLRVVPAPQVVLDPFMGSGSTLVGAKAAGRKATGIEIEERYCEIAAQRCSQEVLAL